MPHDPTIEGEASPDVVRAPDGRFVVTYQSFVHDARGGLAKLYYRTTDRLRAVLAAAPAARDRCIAAPTDRVIDAALAWTPAGLLLGFKTGAGRRRHFEIARSTTGSLDGPWQLVGRPDIRVFGDTIENYQFIAIDGRWKLLATSNQLDRPFLFDLAGDPTQPRGWLHWSTGRELEVPQEPWNTGTGITGLDVRARELRVPRRPAVARRPLLPRLRRRSRDVELRRPGSRRARASRAAPISCTGRCHPTDRRLIGERSRSHVALARRFTLR